MIYAATRIDYCSLTDVAARMDNCAGTDQASGLNLACGRYICGLGYRLYRREMDLVIHIMTNPFPDIVIANGDEIFISR